MDNENERYCKKVAIVRATRRVALMGKYSS